MFLSIITLGMFALVNVWRKKLVKCLRYKECDIRQAQFLLIINEFQEEDLLEVRTV